jgi:DNA-binding PadR family transcriptional regulator
VEGQARCRFVIAPPRHFIYPAVLLLLAEQPRHGYRLVDAALRYGFGPVDRPSIYRALHDLAGDGFLTSWEESPSAGSARSVYGVTDAGQAMLSEWMNVVSAQSAALNGMLKRYDALADEPALTDG